jgi:hypothetical protein
MDLNIKDIDVIEFAHILEGLEPHLKISDEYDSSYGQKKGVWWTNQREHIVRWLLSQPTLGESPYNRRKPNHSSRLTYNRYRCPGTLIWLAEALGEDEEFVRGTAKAAAESRVGSRCGVIRKGISFDRIRELEESYISSKKN